MKNKKKLNPKLSAGDKITLVYMGGDEKYPIHPGQKGTVDGLVDFGNEIIYYVNWDDGRKLSILSTVDKWFKIDDDDETISLTKKDITENTRHLHDELYNRKDIIKYYDLSKLREFLSNIRATGIVNMFESGFYLVCGKERLKDEVKYKKNITNKNALKYVIDNADNVKSLMISGSMNILRKEGKEVTPESVQRLMLRNANQIVMLYMLLPVKDSEIEDENDDTDYDDENDDY